MKNLSEIASFYWVVSIIIVIFLILLWVEGKKEKKAVLAVLFVLYFAVYSYIVFFYRTPASRYRLITSLFHTYQGGFDGLQIKNIPAVKQIALNILLYLPLGMILASAMQGRRLMPILICFFVSFATEIIQYYSRRGYADIDDVLNNTIGCIMGVHILTITMRRKIRLQDTRFIVSKPK